MSRVKLQGVALGTFKGPEGKDVLVYITREWLKLFNGLGIDLAALQAGIDASAALVHSHVSVDITDFTEATQDVIGAMVVAAGGTYDDASGVITFPASSVDITSITARVSRLEGIFPIHGMDGEDGDSGPPGAAGPAGATGATGPPGSGGSGSGSGMPGADGEDGEQGPPGWMGATGPTGSQGPAGQSIPGLDGEDGDQGPPGISGAAGSAGANGATGIQGIPGLDGEDGDMGPPGPPGSSVAGGITPKRIVGMVFDGGGSPPTVGSVGYVVCPFAGTIDQWHFVADQSGSAVVDVWKAAGSIPTNGNTIAGTEKLTLSAQQLSSDTALSTWTTSVSAGDVFGFEIESVSTCTRLTAEVRIQESA